MLVENVFILRKWLLNLKKCFQVIPRKKKVYKYLEIFTIGFKNALLPIILLRFGRLVRQKGVIVLRAQLAKWLLTKTSWDVAALLTILADENGLQ